MEYKIALQNSYSCQSITFIFIHNLFLNRLNGPLLNTKKNEVEYSHLLRVEGRLQRNADRASKVDAADDHDGSPLLAGELFGAWLTWRSHGGGQ